MCGINGIFGFNKTQLVSKETIGQMNDALLHRGPDDDGIYFNPEMNIVLGHRRLSIIDLTTGKQPMSNEDKSVWIVFNGEIYNYRELNGQLLQKGYKFRTTSDTETIIHMYEEYGTKCFEFLYGIFALAILDIKNGYLILARDHLGVKPLYYAFNNDRLVFSSEIKAILKDPAIKIELDFESLNSFLTFRYNPSPQTLFKTIKKLQPAYYLKVDLKGNTEQQTYWNYVPSPTIRISENEAVEEYLRLLRNAVKRQMIADVPVGLLLSGGVDSALLGSLMHELNNEKIKTFTVGFSGKGDFNEIPDADYTSKYIGSEHHSSIITKDSYREFLINNYLTAEEPLPGPTYVMHFYVSKLASKYVKVALSGQGADEPLAGYKRYLGEKYILKFHNLIKSLSALKIDTLFQSNERLSRAFYTARFTNDLERFLAIYTIFTPEQKNGLLNSWTKDKITKNSDLDLINRLYSQTYNMKEPLNKLLYIDTRMNLSDCLLLFGDKMTMANSLEMRVPYLDIDMVKFLESLPSSFKINGLQQKYIHKRAAEKLLPHSIIKRKKRGFDTPWDDWLRKVLSERIKILLFDKNSACRLYFDENYIKNMINEHAAGRFNYGKHIFLLFIFELWHKHFIENNYDISKIESIIS